jgi:AcrR family transcriptional regulator
MTAAKPIPQTDSKLALILAAETVFARDGIDSASLREIAAEAGQRNHHAVQYHFGSREGLVQAVFDYRMEQMEPARSAMLTAARENGQLNDTRTIVEAIFLPQLELIDAYGDHSYAAFLSDYLVRYPSANFGGFGSRLPPHLVQTLDLLRRKMAHLSDAAAQRRLITTCFMFLNILVTHTRGSIDGEEEFKVSLADTVNLIVAAIEAPYPAGD